MKTLLQGWAAAMLLTAAAHAQPVEPNLQVYLHNSTEAAVRIHNALVTETCLFGNVGFSRLDLDTLEMGAEGVLTPSLSATGQAQTIAPGEVVVLEAKDRDGHLSVFMLTQANQASPLYVKYTVTRERGVYIPTLEGCLPAFMRPPAKPFAELRQAAPWMVALVPMTATSGE